MPSLRRAVQTTDYQGDRHMSVGDGLPHEFYAGVAWRLRPIVLPPLRNERAPARSFFKIAQRPSNFVIFRHART
jgi:hypothetical protein